ncbi:hypothetical protein KC19_1G174300 [Ceratodon purpureus]|uniref:Uncharacterized protein n=1 Tax=Ceratodon purpureus TaxID=3225 RepID=A0A8T0J797_CERPU|nr:hypothetical protein KC19_1G174300 [Ceratodon purpureus]
MRNGTGFVTTLICSSLTLWEGKWGWNWGTVKPGGLSVRSFRRSKVISVFQNFEI